MTLDDLKNQIHKLATLTPNNDPMISCYIDCESRAFKFRHYLDVRFREIQASLKESRQDAFLQARMTLESVLSQRTFNQARGLAIFIRAGRRPILEVIELQTPVENSVSIDATAQLYPLVKLKDTYERYVILITTEEFARILEVDVGRVTSEIWTERKELRKAIGRGWSHEHYQNHRRARGEKFISEKIRILEKVMRDSNHEHLIIAGPTNKTAHIRKHLPKWLEEKLVDTIPASSRDASEDVVMATLSAFADFEMQESLKTVTLLKKELATGGLAVAGIDAAFHALGNEQVDMLVIADAFGNHEGRRCNSCGHFHSHMPALKTCTSCWSYDLEPVDLKSELVRQAESQGVDIEIVRDSDFLLDIEGVGCLLRYLTPDQHQARREESRHEQTTSD